MRTICSLLDRTSRRLAFGLAMAGASVAGAVGAVGTMAGAVHADDDVPSSLRPVAECVIVNGDGSFTAFFGYSNDTGREIVVPVSSDNRIDERVGQPVVRFRVGRVVAAFSVTTRATTITWRLGDQRIRVTAESTPCSTNPTVPEAPVALVLLVAPAGMTAWWMRRRQRLQSPC
ncbi:MAG: hypothetical protein KDB40_16380 [Acidimicrobiales bacterium]|nr:hypothetical protein [Acidimicrobiales bacterium]MCB9395573.1 hypothetical protein [Acidimicrobiaceae bacterium]